MNSKTYISFSIHANYIHIFERTTIHIKEGKEDKLLFVCVRDRV